MAAVMVLVILFGRETASASTNGIVTTAFPVQLQNTANGNGNGTVASVGGLSSISINISGTYTGVINFEGTVDDTNWVSLTCVNPATGATATSATSSDTVWTCPVSGMDQVRARISGYGSGTISATAIGTQTGTNSLVPSSYSYQSISTAATTTVKSGAGVLRSISINTPGSSGSTITVYDNTAGSGAKIATISGSGCVCTLQYDDNFNTGLTIVTGGQTGAADLTVNWR